MRGTFWIGLMIVLIVTLAVFSFADPRGKLSLNVEDELYVCNCVETCPCNMMSRNPGNCNCGMDLVKAKVTLVEEGKANLKAEGWGKERTFKTVGMYACACSAACNCDTIKQVPGKCSCGLETKRVDSP